MVNCVHSAVNVSFQLSTQTSLVNMNAVPNCSVPDRLRFYKCERIRNIV